MAKKWWGAKVRLVGEKSPSHSSYEKGCQEKKFLPAPLRDAGVGDLHPSPTSFLTSFLEGVLVWSLWLAAFSRGDANPICLSQLEGFMKSVAHDAVRFRSYAS